MAAASDCGRGAPAEAPQGEEGEAQTETEGARPTSALLISFDPDLTDLRQLKSELARVLFAYNPNGKVVIQKTPSGFKSPNLADAVMMAFAPTSPGIEIIGIF